MTLIVYKDGILAGDTRTSISRATPEPTTCGHCDKETHMVNDQGSKLSLFRTTTKAVFRGEKVLAMGGAGRSPFIKRLTNLIRLGGDLEASYKGYIDIMGESFERGFACSLLLVCFEHCYVVEANDKGALIVTQHDRSESLAIGSQLHTVKWMNHIMKSITAIQIVNATMAMAKNIGGEIHYIDFNKPVLTSEIAPKVNPMEIVDNLAFIYEEGERSIRTQLEPKKPATRKSPVKKVR